MKEYIEREAAIDFVASIVSSMSVCVSKDEWRGMDSTKKRAISALKDVPTADVVEVRHGRWILDDETGVPICSECHSGKPTKCVCSSVIDHKLSNYEIRYCYYCGAKMDKEVK